MALATAHALEYDMLIQPGGGAHIWDGSAAGWRVNWNVCNGHWGSEQDGAGGRS